MSGFGPSEDWEPRRRRARSWTWWDVVRIAAVAAVTAAAIVYIWPGW